MLPRSSHLRHPSLRPHYVSKYLHMALSSKNRIYFIPLLARKCSGKSQIRSNSPWESLTRYCSPIEVPHIVSWIQVRHGLPQRYLPATTCNYHEGHFTGHRISLLQYRATTKIYGSLSHC